MNKELFKGQYICYLIWVISSILFFFFSFYNWMEAWMKITVGLLQLASVGYYTYGLYKTDDRQHFIICLIAFCIDVVVTVFILKWTLSHSIAI